MSTIGLLVEFMMDTSIPLTTGSRLVLTTSLAIRMKPYVIVACVSRGLDLGSTDRWGFVSDHEQLPPATKGFV